MRHLIRFCFSCIALLATTLTWAGTCSECPPCTGGGPCLCIANQMIYGNYTYDRNTTPSTATFVLSPGSPTPVADSRFDNDGMVNDSRLLVCLIEGTDTTNYYFTLTDPADGVMNENPPTNSGASLSLNSVTITPNSGNSITSDTCQYSAASPYACSWYVTGTVIINSGLNNLSTELNNGFPVSFSRDLEMNLYEVN